MKSPNCSTPQGSCHTAVSNPCYPPGTMKHDTTTHDTITLELNKAEAVLLLSLLNTAADDGPLDDSDNERDYLETAQRLRERLG